jgi:hypothetical protein
MTACVSQDNIFFTWSSWLCDTVVDLRLSIPIASRIPSPPTCLARTKRIYCTLRSHRAAKVLHKRAAVGLGWVGLGWVGAASRRPPPTATTTTTQGQSYGHASVRSKAVFGLPRGRAAADAGCHTSPTCKMYTPIFIPITHSMTNYIEDPSLRTR